MSSSFKTFSFPGDTHTYLAPSWEAMGELNFELIKQVYESDKKYEVVVALAKGGWTWARAFVDGLGMDELASLRIKLYKGINSKSEKPAVIQPLSVDISGKTVLLFDDVVDSGETYKFAKELLLKEYKALSVDTAALFWKPATARVTPTFSAAVTDAWVVFPHEVNEFVSEAGASWRASGLTDAEILGRFEQMGLPLKQAEFYLSKI